MNKKNNKISNGVNQNKYNAGWIIILCLSLAPIILWLNAPSFLPRFGNLANTFASIGQILGLAGATLFALSLILSARLRSFEALFYGLNNVYLKHGQVGQLALILLLFHPLFLIPKYAGNIHDAAAFLWLSGNWAVNWGILSLGLMIFLIVITLYLRPKYNIWKWTHKFLGFAFFLASLHIWLIPSDTSRYLPLKIYILTLSALGLMAFVYRSILGKFLIKKYSYTVSKIYNLGDIVEISMKPQGEPIKFKAGQFIFINFKQNEIGSEAHPFSIISSPKNEYLSIAIKNLGDYTSKIKQLKIDTIAEIEGPFGTFSYENTSNKSQIWIAGGIGITPFLSMAQSLPANTDYDIILYYCAKNKDEGIYLDLLLKISNYSNDSLKIFPFYSDDNGWIAVDHIEKISGAANGKDIFICAPPRMIADFKKQFLARGVKKKNIHSEEFNF